MNSERKERDREKERERERERVAYFEGGLSVVHVRERLGAKTAFVIVGLHAPPSKETRSDCCSTCRALVYVERFILI